MRILFVISAVFLCSVSNFAAEKIRVGEILARIENMQDLVKELKQRVKTIKRTKNSLKSISINLCTLAVLEKSLGRLKADLGLFKKEIINNQENLIEVDKNKSYDIARKIIAINSRTCDQIINDKISKLAKVNNLPKHLKLIIDMETNCGKAQELLSKGELGHESINSQLALNNQLTTLLSQW